MKDYTSLKTKYTDIQKKSEHIQELEYDRELMYAIMDNNEISHIYDKHKRNMKDGFIMSARLEIAKYKSRQQPHSQHAKTTHRTQAR